MNKKDLTTITILVDGSQKYQSKQIRDIYPIKLAHIFVEKLRFKTYINFET